MPWTDSADCALMAAGTIRGDQVYPPGPIRVRDITDCFPFEDPVVVLKVTGQAIREALENSVSLYPALEGRFPQVSNIRFTFDPKRPVGERVTAVDIAGDGYLPEKVYVLATRGYMGRGKGGSTLEHASWSLRNTDVIRQMATNPYLLRKRAAKLSSSSRRRTAF